MLMMDDDDELPIRALPGETRLSRQLGKEGLRAIDAAILSHATPSWAKVASIVFRALKSGGFGFGDDASHLHVRRVGKLVKSGQLEGEGNLRRPRYSEVRLHKSEGAEDEEGGAQS